MQHFHNHDAKRTGPNPLWLHLNGGAAMMAVASDTDNMFAASQAILNEALEGVKAYHNSDVKPFDRQIINVAEVEGSKLITGESWTGKDAVIIIPSLINGWEILDIEERHSFIAFIYQSGFVPLVVDWHKPVSDISMNDYICSHLTPLIQKAKKLYNVKGVIGYCMGGTMIAALYSVFSNVMQGIDKAILIAPPWDFSYQSLDQEIRLQSLAMQTYVMGDIAPNDYVQSLFWAVDPLQVIKKFRKFPNVQNPDRFVRVEDWLNAGRPVSKSVIQTCLFEWYRDNAIMNGLWTINGQTVSDDDLPENTLIVAGTQDNLVPLASVAPLHQNRQTLKVNTGHIGLMASDKAIEKCWKPIADFLKADKV